jgi:hypothetical protein
MQLLKGINIIPYICTVEKNRSHIFTFTDHNQQRLCGRVD